MLVSLVFDSKLKLFTSSDLILNRGISQSGNPLGQSHLCSYISLSPDFHVEIQNNLHGI